MIPDQAPEENNNNNNNMGRPGHRHVADVSCGNLRAATRRTSLGWSVSSHRRRFVGGMNL